MEVEPSVLVMLRYVGEGRVTKLMRGPASIYLIDGKNHYRLGLRAAEKNGWITDGPYLRNSTDQLQMHLTELGRSILTNK